jgi:tetratricopeptide (TPR) repeat protein
MKHKSIILPITRSFVAYTLIALALLLGIVSNGASLISAINANWGANLLLEHLDQPLEPAVLDNAQARLERALEDASFPSATRYRMLGLIALRSGEYEKARVAFEQAELTAADLLAYGHSANHLAQEEDARRWFEFAVRYDADSGDAWYYWGLSLQDQRELAQAEQAYTAGISAPHRTEIGLSDLYFGRAEVRRLQQKYAAAQEDYERALALNQFTFAYAEIHSLDKLASIYLRQARYAAAIPLLQQAIAQQPSFDWPHYRLGTAFYECCGDVEQALQYLDQGIAANPDNPWGYLLSGDIYLAEGDRAEARSLYQKALEINPDWPAAAERLRQTNE